MLYTGVYPGTKATNGKDNMGITEVALMIVTLDNVRHGSHWKENIEAKLVGLQLPIVSAVRYL